MKNSKKIRSIFVLLLAAAILILSLIIYGLPKVQRTLERTYISEYKTLEQSDDVTGYIVRNEKVYSSAVSGNIKYKIKEGTKVRGGIRIASLEGEVSDKQRYGDLTEKLGDNLVQQDSLVSKMIGVVSYNADGYEGKLKQSTLLDLRFEDAAVIGNDAVNLKRDTVVAGEPVYKIFSNMKWWIVYWVKAEDAGIYDRGQRVTVKFGDGDVRATVTSKVKQGDKVRIILRSNLYYKSLATVRKADIKVILRTYSGIYVENSSIVERKGQKGVMVRNTSGEFVFTPISIIFSNNGESIIWADSYIDKNGKTVSTVEAYDEILKTPEKYEH